MYSARLVIPERGVDKMYDFDEEWEMMDWAERTWENLSGSPEEEYHIWVSERGDEGDRDLWDDPESGIEMVEYEGRE